MPQAPFRNANSVNHMKTKPNASWLLTCFSCLSAIRLMAAPVIIATPEDWNGFLNPHEADGVTLTGSGAPGDPAVYTIPDGMRIESTGAIRLTAEIDNESDSANIIFVFARGNLQIDLGGYLETSLGNRNDTRSFVLDMGGGSVTGNGRIVGLRDVGPRNRKPRGLTMINVRDVFLEELDLHVENVSSEIEEDLVIAASGQVRIRGMVNYSDTDLGGNPVRAVRIEGESVEVGGVDTRAFRTGPPGRSSGDVVLRALSPAGNFDPASPVNRFANRVTVNGPVRTDGNGPGGDVTIQGVVVQTGGLFVLRPGTGATATVQAGLDTLGVPRSDLVIDGAGSGIAAQVAHVVQWDGVRAPGSAPVFTVDPVLLATALPDVAYAGTLAGTATDPDGNPLTFARGAGPAWLTVAPGGELSGTPTAADAGVNTWTISVSDGTRSDVALLRIGVSGRPTFFSNPVIKPKAFQNQAYAGTLSDVAADPDGDAITFTKIDGPAWLSVGSNGSLSGTPPPTATGWNAWTVRVADAGGSDTVTLRILVGGNPQWLADPVLKSVARAGSSYGDSGQSLAGDAVDPDGDAVTFAKVSGPAWLQVASNGALSGTPATGDLGLQTWVVRASDGSGGNTATLRIEVIEISGAIRIDQLEIWDGVQNPHAADGVILLGSGTPEDPAIYQIPTGLRFTATGAIHMTTPGGADRSIRFNFGPGRNLEMAAGAYINLGRRQRSGLQTFVLDLGGGSIIGAGEIAGVLIRDDSPRQLTIQNARDVSLRAINLQVFNANNGGRRTEITATGTVAIPWIDVSDRDSGGNQVGDVVIRADSMLLGTIDTRSLRTGSYRGNGSISLTALGAPAYEPSVAAGNDFANRIIVNGRLRTQGPALPPNPGADGNILLEGVGITLNSITPPNVPDGSAIIARAGTLSGGAAETDLFFDASGFVIPEYVVAWTGGVRIPATPALLSVQPYGFGAARLAWSMADPLASEFVLEQSPDGVAFVPVATVSGGLRTAEVGGLLAGRTYSFRLKAGNGFGASAYSGVGTVTIPVWGLSVNLAAATFTEGQAGYPIPGYLDDYGAMFGDRGNGWFYGWNMDNSANSRFRANAYSPDPRHDTFNHLQRAGDFVWEAAVPNGLYRVRLLAGDVAATDSTFQFDVEGVLTAAQAPALPAAFWREFTVEAQVNDGRLTIRSGPQAANNKLCFIDVARLQLTGVPAITAIAAVDGNVTVQWTGGGVLEGSSSLSAGWTPLGVDGTWTEPVSGPARFFRLRW
jgi:hypothetical protein